MPDRRLFLKQAAALPVLACAPKIDIWTCPHCGKWHPKKYATCYSGTKISYRLCPKPGLMVHEFQDLVIIEVGVDD